jgi:branched-chain amino acid transport system substrate-binding protein
MKGCAAFKRLWVAAGLVLAAALMGACGDDGGGGGGGKGVKIALVTDLSGPFKSFGEDIRPAVRLALDEVNADGGIGGSKVGLVIRNSGGVAERAVVAERELAEDEDVIAIVGPLSSGEAEVAFSQIGRLEVPTITGTANKDGITELGKGWAFRNTAPNKELFSEAMPVYAKAFDVANVAMIFDAKQPVTAAAAEQTIPPAAEAAGIKIADTFTVETGQTDFTSVVQKAKDVGGIDGLFVMTGPVEGGLLAREIGRQDIGLPVLGHNAQNSVAFRDTAGEAVQDWVVPTPFSPEGAGPKGVEFAEKLAEVHKEPTPVPEVANYYDIVKMVAKVADEAKVDGDMPIDEARQAVRDGLLKLKNYEGAGGTISFRSNGDAAHEVWAVSIRGEETKLVK